MKTFFIQLGITLLGMIVGLLAGLASYGLMETAQWIIANFGLDRFGLLVCSLLGLIAGSIHAFQYKE